MKIVVHLFFNSGQIACLESEIEAVRLAAGTAVPHKTLPLPEEMAATSMQTINSLNEYVIQLLQVCIRPPT